MSVPAVLVQRLAQAGIVEAAIIDDVFDGPAFLDIRARLDGFREDVEDDDEATMELLNKYNVANAGLVEMELVRELWKDVDALRALQKHLRLLLTDYMVRLEMVERIVSNLSELGISVKRFGDADKEPQKLPPESFRLILLDYSLAPDADSPNEASEWCATQLCARTSLRPFLVLISDHEDAQAHKDSFRDKTHQLAGTFAFIRKQEAQEADVLYFQIATWGIGHPAHTHLQAFVESTVTAIDQTAQQFKSAISALTVQDYSFLQRTCLEEEGQPLGEYVLDFFTGLLSHQFRASPLIQESRQALDRLVFEHHLSCVTQPSSELATMYRLALTDPVFGGVGPHPHVVGGASSYEKIAALAYQIWESEGRPVGREEAHWRQAERQLIDLPLLGLGDIFTKDAGSKIWMVVNAACDLLFSPRSSGRKGRPEQPIYVIPGVLADLRQTADLQSREVTELFEFGGKAYRILWDYRYVRSIELRDFEKEMISSGYIRSARLTLPYALKVQRVWTAHLDRVGLPSPPPMFEQADVSVYAQADGKWALIGGPVRGGAVLVRRKVNEGYEELCVLTIEGEAAVSTSLRDAIAGIDKQVLELEQKAAQAKPTETFWPKKIQQRSDVGKKLMNEQKNITWRLGLLEQPKVIVSSAPTWIVKDMIAMYFEGGAKCEFANQAQLVVDISRPSSTGEPQNDT